MRNELAESLEVALEKLQIRSAEAGSVIIHASVLGFADQAGADALARGLLEKPPVTSFGECEVIAAACVANGEDMPTRDVNVVEAQQVCVNFVFLYIRHNACRYV